MLFFSHIRFTALYNVSALTNTQEHESELLPLPVMHIQMVEVLLPKPSSIERARGRYFCLWPRSTEVVQWFRGQSSFAVSANAVEHTA